MSTIPHDHPASTTVLPHEHYWQAAGAHTTIGAQYSQHHYQILVCRCGAVRAVESTRWEWLRGEEGQ